MTRIWAAAAAIFIASSASGIAGPVAVSIDPGKLRAISILDTRYQSYNIEMAEIIGAKFWKPYGPEKFGGGEDKFAPRAPIDLADPRLRKLAAALGPTNLRVSGTWANTVHFQDNDDPIPAAPPKGFTGTLTRREWKGVVDFAHAVDADLVTSFAIGPGVRDASGVWTPVEARKLVAYTNSIGGRIVAAEFFNEPDLPAIGGAPVGYDAAMFGRDAAAFRDFQNDVAPDMIVVGPGTAGDGAAHAGMLAPRDLLAAAGPKAFDIFSYHFYGALSERCTGSGVPEDDALSEEWLAKTERVSRIYQKLRDTLAPDKPMWITETAEAACGGDRWASTFLDSFNYLDQLARLARNRIGVKAVFHNTLAASDYGLLDSKTFAPRPDYWAALLWRRFMGENVLDAGALRPGFHIYAQCLRGRAGGVALLAINLSRTDAASLTLSRPSLRYTLSAATLTASQVSLNGTPLALTSGDDIPALAGAPERAGSISVAPETVTFLAIAGAQNRNCR